MSHRHTQDFCALDAASQKIFKMAIDELHFSARAHDKILKVARTIADLSGETSILPEHIAEAVQYRSLDRNFYC